MFFIANVSFWYFEIAQTKSRRPQTIKKRTTKYKTQIKIKYVFANHGLTGLKQQRSTKMGHLI